MILALRRSWLKIPVADFDVIIVSALRRKLADDYCSRLSSIMILALRIS
jgi:hypothetical protein